MLRKRTCFLIFLVNLIVIVKCGYPPIGDEVQQGSVLLPATRRGRYLANIVRRQAVDGTGIKFNKDADRMNADAKKKVDVLSEELLPYIIAEQERRTTLYKRIMTAIQNGEKGVTIAEMRNKDPLIIKRGQMFRCPSGRSPKEPDGSGSILCDNNDQAVPIVFDSCLSAEDKELYVSNEEYFFCDRHRIEGPDLPRNGSTVIGCAPSERTSFNYTLSKCGLEGSEDVVVHYRYYPDRTYKFVTELDPDREICDHWNPCQIGYIFALPNMDSASASHDIWPTGNYYEQDSNAECMIYDKPYEFARTMEIPESYTASYVERHGCQHCKEGVNSPINQNYVNFDYDEPGFVIVTIKWPRFPSTDKDLWLVFESEKGEKRVKLADLCEAEIAVLPNKTETIPGQSLDEEITVKYTCDRCTLNYILIRGNDGNIAILDKTRYKIKDNNEGKYIQLKLGVLQPKDIGQYYGQFTDGNGNLERVKLLTIVGPRRVLNFKRIKAAGTVGMPFDQNLVYSCESCEVTDVICHGESVVANNKVAHISATKTVVFNFPNFQDEHACVYVAIFKQDGITYSKVVAVIENDYVSVTEDNVEAPKLGEGLEIELPISCDSCTVTKVDVNGIALNPEPTRRYEESPVAYYVSTPGSLKIRVTKFAYGYCGVYQVEFSANDKPVTKTILEIKDPHESEGAADAAPEAPADGEKEAGDKPKDAAPDAGADPSVDGGGEAPDGANPDEPPPDAPPDGEAAEAEEGAEEEGRRKHHQEAVVATTIHVEATTTTTHVPEPPATTEAVVETTSHVPA